MKRLLHMMRRISREHPVMFSSTGKKKSVSASFRPFFRRFRGDDLFMTQSPALGGDAFPFFLAIGFLAFLSLLCRRSEGFAPREATLRRSETAGNFLPALHSASDCLFRAFLFMIDFLRV